jgi:hypothetical protein
VKDIAIEELWETVFSVRSVPKLYKEDQLPVPVGPSGESREESRGTEGSHSVEKLVAGAWDSSGTQRK